MDAMHEAAKSDCICQGTWLTHVKESFQANAIPVPELCHDILHALREGRNETVPVIVLAGSRGGEGKSLFLKALFAVFGDKH
eukprot:3828843-Karenia_brevis.AAC.1